MSDKKPKYSVNQWVWYMGKNSISNSQITRIENGVCVFEIEGCQRVEVEEKKCYPSLEDMIKQK